MKVFLLIPLLSVSFLFGQEVTNNSKNIDQKLELEGAYFYRALIKGEFPSSGAPLGKTANGFGLGLHYSVYVKEKIFLEAGLMVISDIHLRDSVALYCGRFSCTYGYSRLGFTNWVIPYHLGYETKLGKSTRLNVSAGLLISQGFYDRQKRFYYDGTEYENWGGSFDLDYMIANASIKCGLIFNINERPVSLLYRYARPLNRLERSNVAYVRHGLGLSFGIWSK